MTMAEHRSQHAGCGIHRPGPFDGVVGGSFSGGKFRRGQRRKRAQAGGEGHAHDESQWDEQNAADQQAISEVHSHQRGQTAGQEKTSASSVTMTSTIGIQPRLVRGSQQPRKQASRAAGEHQQKNHHVNA